jgi:hypothetical protein
LDYPDFVIDNLLGNAEMRRSMRLEYQSRIPDSQSLNSCAAKAAGGRTEVRPAAGGD